LLESSWKAFDEMRREDVAPQDMDEMELLMARADEERRALEREVRTMRSTASEAASQLLLAEEELSVRFPPVMCVQVLRPRNSPKFGSHHAPIKEE
jgi:hypothetical protein